VAISQALKNANSITLQQYRRRDGVTYRPSAPTVGQFKPPQKAKAKAWPELPEAVRHYPTLGIAFIKNDLSAAGRVWLLLRAYDQAGQGCLYIRQIRELLTVKGSPWRTVGRRRLRQILKEGESIFWDRYTADQIWLRSPAKVAVALNSGCLTGSPVELPILGLLGGISHAKAAFLAAWHAGRGSDKPISQAKIRELTGIPEATQRRYYRATGVKAERQIAVSAVKCALGDGHQVIKGEHNDQAAIEHLAYRHGRKMFAFYDHQGKRGKRRQTYLAWHLPNIYRPSYKQAAKGRQKKHNRQIDLVSKGVQGNGLKVARIFHPKASQAAKAYNRDPQNDAYFPAAGLWGVALAQ